MRERKLVEVPRLIVVDTRQGKEHYLEIEEGGWMPITWEGSDLPTLAEVKGFARSLYRVKPNGVKVFPVLMTTRYIDLNCGPNGQLGLRYKITDPWKQE